MTVADTRWIAGPLLAAALLAGCSQTQSAQPLDP